MNFAAEPLRRTTRSSLVGLERVPENATWRVIATATRFGTCHTHWTDGRTFPCLLPDAPCRPCELALEKRFAAYLGCFNLSRRQDMVISIPEGAYLDCKQLAGEQVLDGKLRGTLWQFRRGGTRREKLSVELLGREEDEASIPAKLNVPVILYRCWGLPPPAATAPIVSRLMRIPDVGRK